MTGNRIREARIAQGLFQWQLAMQCGVSSKAISNWEAGRATPMNMEMWCKLATVLHTTVGWLMGEDVLRGKDDGHERGQ